MPTHFQFQPFELVFPTQNGPAQAHGDFVRNEEKFAADLREIDGFLFFNFQNGDPEGNFLVGAMHSAITNPPRRAFEKLGLGQTLTLLTRRAINHGFWGRLFVLNDAHGERFLVFLGNSGRHLLTSWREYKRNPRAEWTPFEWDKTPDLVGVSSSELYEIVAKEWSDSGSELSRVKSWSEADYFERLWRSLNFQHGDAITLRQILRDAASLVTPEDGAYGWVVRFQLPEKGDSIDLYEQLFEERGSRQIPLSSEVYDRLSEVLQEFAPRRMRAREAGFLAQREWLEGNSGVGNWSLSVQVRALSAHEKMETLLRLRSNLEKIWEKERARDWLAPFLKVN
ncbi:hypothetical protein EON80_14465 [bacterium]|nr:MAG: hypothetical protein EON80_14465 [bacterium]